MGREGAFTHVESCVRPLQPEAGQAQAGAGCCHKELSITCGPSGVDVELLNVVVEAARGIVVHLCLSIDGVRVLLHVEEAR